MTANHLVLDAVAAVALFGIAARLVAAWSGVAAQVVSAVRRRSEASALARS